MLCLSWGPRLLPDEHWRRQTAVCMSSGLRHRRLADAQGPTREEVGCFCRASLTLTHGKAR